VQNNNGERIRNKIDKTLEKKSFQVDSVLLEQGNYGRIYINYKNCYLDFDIPN